MYESSVVRESVVKKFRNLQASEETRETRYFEDDQTSFILASYTKYYRLTCTLYLKKK